MMELTRNGSIFRWSTKMTFCVMIMLGTQKKTQKKEKLGQTKEVSIGTRVQIRSSRPPLDILC